MTGMSIQEISSDIKRLFWSPDLLVLGIVVAVAFGSFWLGRLSVSEGGGNGMSGVEAATASSAVGNTEITPGAKAEVHEQISTDSDVAPQNGEQYIGSKNGTKYHLPWCSGALRIKEENKVWFASKAEAEEAGYSPAANCKGI